jgi:integrase
MPRHALLQALNYMEGERAAAVRRAQREGRYERLPGARIIVETLAGGRLRLRSRDGRISDVALDGLNPVARRRLLRETAAGLEPAALWLNEDGSARAPRGWHHTFTTANQRLARLGFVGFAAAAHMMRHSFALRWYSVGKLVYRAQLGHLTEAETHDFREQFGDVWGLVQLLLGHQDVQTTKATYLEPFQSLALEMLLHAADAAIPQLMAELLRSHARVLSDPVREAG